MYLCSSAIRKCDASGAALPPCIDLCYLSVPCGESCGVKAIECQLDGVTFFEPPSCTGNYLSIG